MKEPIEADYGRFMADLAIRIRTLREERGWTFRDMIFKHDYAESQWRRYEREGSANVPTLLRIAKVFELSLCQLLDGLGEYPAKSLDAIKKDQCSPGKAAAKKSAKKSVVKKSSVSAISGSSRA